MKHFLKFLVVSFVAAMSMLSCSDEPANPNDPSNEEPGGGTPGTSQVFGSDNHVTINADGTASDGATVVYDGGRKN